MVSAAKFCTSLPDILRSKANCPSPFQGRGKNKEKSCGFQLSPVKPLKILHEDRNADDKYSKDAMVIIIPGIFFFQKQTNLI